MTKRPWIEDDMTALGFSLVRRNKHLVWRNAAGVTVVTSATPGDDRARRNAVKVAQRVLRLAAEACVTE